MNDAVSSFLQVLYGSTVRPYSTYDFGRAQDPDCISVIAPARDARKKLPLLRERLPAGRVAFIGTSRWLGDEQHEGVEVVVGKCQSQFDILRVARIHHLTERLKRYDDLYDIDIFEASTHALGFMLMTRPDDLHSFAEELHQLYPNVGSLDAFRENIRMTSEVHLWWD